MTRVLTFTLSLSRNAGGLFNSVRRLSQCCHALGYDYHIFGPKDEYTVEDLNNWLPLEPKSYEVVGPKGIGFCPSLRSFAIKLDPQILHQHGLWMYHSKVNSLIAGRLNVPYAISPRGMLDSWAMKNSRWKKRIAWLAYEKRNLTRANCLHALCRSELESIRKLGLQNPICVIPNGVDLPPDREHRRDSRSNPVLKRTFLFIGRIHPKKGLDLLVDAVARIKRTNEARALDFRVIVAGWDDGRHVQALKLRCQENGVQWADYLNATEYDAGMKGDILYLGPVYGERKETLLRNSDAFILPSYSEGLPVAILEAWAYGLPVLMTEECNLPEGFQMDCAGRIATNVDSIVRGLTNMASASKESLVAMGNRGQQLVANRFTWKAIAAAHDDVYKWMLSECKPPSSIFFAD